MNLLGFSKRGNEPAAPDSRLPVLQGKPADAEQSGSNWYKDTAAARRARSASPVQKWLSRLGAGWLRGFGR